MKTAMRNHILDMKKIQSFVRSKNMDKRLEEIFLETIEGCIENAESFIKAEKEQINEAYGAGAMDASYDIDNVDPEKYYRKTFKLS